MSAPAAAPPAAVPPSPTPAPAEAVKGELVDYIVFEPTGGQDEDLSFRAKVKATGRPDAIEKACGQNEDLKRRVEEGKVVNLLPLAARYVNPEPVQLEVEERRTFKIGGGA